MLGSMPGSASLAAGEYYAHPRNQFWQIMAELCGFDPAAPYGRRTAGLGAAGIALWDVIARCARRGSLDTGIEPASIVVNDFPGFLAAHPRIERIFFNGSRAEAIWHRQVAPNLPAGRMLYCQRLPSTSPAHAGMTYAGKLRTWRVVTGGAIA